MEAKGEIIEYIHICEKACGQSRDACGKKIPSERPAHQLEEIWNPLGVTGVITAFNFPIAVYGWNAAIAMYTGNTMVSSSRLLLIFIALLSSGSRRQHQH